MPMVDPRFIPMFTASSMLSFRPRQKRQSELSKSTVNSRNKMKDSKMKNLIQCVAILATASLAASTSQATNILGIDVSHFQGTINWTSVHNDGVKFASAKATEGNTFHDPDFTANMVNGKAAGVQMLAYDFARPDSISAATEGNYFWAFAGPYIISDGKSLYPMVDFEVFSGHVGSSSYTTWMNSWATNVKGHTTTFLRPVLYASAGTGMCDLTTACTLSAWVANYNGQNLFTGNPWSCCTSCNYVDPGTTADWTYWQVSSTGSITGISGNVDLDAYPLSLADLIAFQGVGQ
jgi:lysozyme